MVFTRCAVCNADGAAECSTCNSIAYCSPKCRSDDEATHKLLCEEIGHFITSSPRPTTGSVLAVYFPQDLMHVPGKVVKLELIWLDGRNKVEKDSSTGELVHTDVLKHDRKEREILGLGPSSWRTGTMEKPHDRVITINRNNKGNFNIGHTICLYKRDAFNFDGSRMNLCLVETLRGDVSYPFRGPLVVYSCDTRQSRQDVTLTDFRTFVDFCRTYRPGDMGEALLVGGFRELESRNPDLFTSLLHIHGGDTEIKAVEITCAGDAFFLKLDKYLPVDITNIHPVWDIEYIKPTEITKLLEFPLLVRRVLPDPSWGDRVTGWGASPYANPFAHALDIIVDPESDRWGCEGFGQYEVLGRVLVAREDKKSITPRQTEAIISFIQDYVEPKMETERDNLVEMELGQMLAARKKFVKDNISKDKFEQFFNKLKKGKIEAGDASWKDEISPYQVQDVPENLSDSSLSDGSDEASDGEY